MQVVSRYFSCALVLLSLYPLVAQNNTSVVQIHETLGDTIDRDEKVRFNLFQDVRNSEFMQAVCLVQNNEMTLWVQHSDSSITYFPYSSELMFDDMDRVYQNMNTTYVPPPVENLNLKTGKIIVKITSSSGRSIKLRKKKSIELKLKNEQRISRMKIIKILTGNSNGLLVKNGSGNLESIYFSEIEYINRYKKAEYFVRRGIGGSYFVLGSLLLFGPSASEDYPFSIAFMSGGIIPFFFKNEHIMVDTAEINVYSR